MIFRLQLLGKLTLSYDGEIIDIPGRQLQVLLALLAINANRPVSKGWLTGEIWDNACDVRSNALHALVFRLRKLLAGRISEDFAARRLVTSNRGYQLCLEEGELDITTFETLVSRAQRDKAVDPVLALAHAHAALDLWHSPALEDLRAGECLSGVAARLEEQHLWARELQVDLAIEAGRYASVRGVLRELTLRYPFNERFSEWYMLALYHSGRQTEALGEFRRISRALRSELGLEPCPPLRELQQAVLRHSVPVAYQGSLVEGGTA
ncbi:AfsR/SARP family transcriptional regulator [Streptomyces adelaidensis]|uniref:AfsR/SARP family transcriptional regulator n=1 Tax=Streptomyces adelaidensis TaxID=2796465 RepID=UPI001904D193|nr:AfsR/SARP family transcriptional regulator [Streptomyces adelaidensis]